MVRIAIPVEIKDRELIGKVWLAMTLAADGHEVVIGPKSDIRSQLLTEIQPDVFITKDSSYDERRLELLTRLQEAGCCTVVMDAEGGVIDSKDDYFDRRISKSILERTDLIFAWGEVPASVVRERTDFPDDRLWVTGNPRFDVLHRPLREIYRPEAEQRRDTYGKYVLVNTNLVVANPYEISVREMIMDSMPTKSAERRLEQEHRILDQLVTGLARVAPTQEHQFVLRPHPTENPEYYRERFAGIDSVVIDYDGDVRPWILGADAVIHYRSTTGIESALLNTRPLAFEPEGDVDRSYGSPLPVTVSERIRTIDAVPDRLEESNREGPGYTLSPSQQDELRRYFANTQELAAPQIATVLTDYFRDRGPAMYAPVPPKQRFKRLVKATPLAPPIQRIRGLHKDENKYVNHKIPGITQSEIADVTDQFQCRFSDRSFQIRRLNYIDELFSLVSDSDRSKEDL